MSRPSKTDQELAAFRDLWNEIRTIEAEYHGAVTVLFNAVARPGVFEVQLIFTPMFGGTVNALGMQIIRASYPNVERSNLAGFLWRKAIALGRMVEEANEVAKSAASNGA